MSQNFYKNKNLLNIPWVESPFFLNLLKNSKATKELKRLAKKYHEDGYVVIDLKLKDNFIRKINHDIDEKIKKNEIKKNPKIYHYNQSPRIVEAWKFSKSVAQLALNDKIHEILNFFYQKKPLPISTLNFIKGTEQPLHSDYMHFATIPERYLAGVWIALEDTNKFNGALTVIPKSHQFPIVDFNSFNLKKPDSIQSLEKCYRVYEKYVKELISIKQLKPKKIYIKKGQAIIWAANLLHGGSKLLNNKFTRRSQVVHYHFKSCKKYFNPGFSIPLENDYAIRKLDIVRK
jgi:ectoine hydroxylase-related dioxygenase (phytanoyl-CoA dioxygenase family)